MVQEKFLYLFELPKKILGVLKMKKIWTINELNAIAHEALQREDWNTLETVSYFIRLEIRSINEDTRCEKEIEGVENYDCVKKNIEIPVKNKAKSFYCDNYIEYERLLGEYAGNIEHSNWDDEFNSGMIITKVMKHK
jgi:hypothetical protein